MAKAVMLTVAGSDSSAGAGIQADLKAGIALGSFPLTVLSCATAQVPGQVAAIAAMQPDFVAQQLQLCLRHYPVSAIKTGMLYCPAIIEAVADVLACDGRGIPLVVDPVMIATAGQSLMQHEALDVYCSRLFPMACLITPNRDELCALSGIELIDTAEQMRAAASLLAQRYHCSILAKGGHLPGCECEDVLVLANGASFSWRHARIEGVSTHGTGCTLSAAVAALLAQGLALPQAVAGGLDFVQRAIAGTYRWPSPCSMEALATPFSHS